MEPTKFVRRPPIARARSRREGRAGFRSGPGSRSWTTLIQLSHHCDQDKQPRRHARCGSLRNPALHTYMERHSEVATSTRTNWRTSAACLGMDPNVFFPENGESGSEAKAVCMGCPVQSECLEAGKYEQGIWGGRSMGKSYRRRSKALAAKLEPSAGSANRGGSDNNCMESGASSVGGDYA